MRTIPIIGTDWSGPDPHFRRQPFLDGGRLGFNRKNLTDWNNLWYEVADIARADAIAVGIRGVFDTEAVAALPLAVQSYETYPFKKIPKLMPFADTGALPDVVNLPNRGDHQYDFANPDHLEKGWELYARVFFEAFQNVTTLERSPNGKVLMLWWSINTSTGHGFTNQSQAQRLLDLVDAKVAALGLKGVDHIVDVSWIEHDPNLNVFGVHAWFNAWKSPPSAFSIYEHKGLSVGIIAPSFHAIINPDGNAQTLRAALTQCRASKTDYIFIESATNFSEATELMRDSTGNTSKLDAIREHITLTGEAPVPPVEPEPVTPPTPEPKAKVYATFAISQRESFDHPTKSGARVTWHPKGQRETILSVQGNGEISTRLLHAPPAPEGVPFDHTVHGLGGEPGEWETWTPVGNRAVFDGTPEFYAIPLVP